MFKGIFTRSFHTFSTDLRGYMSLSFIHFHRLFISLYRFTFFSTPSPLTVTPYFLVSPLLVYLQSFLFYFFLFSSNNFFFFSNLILLLFFDYSFVFRTKTDHFFFKLIIKHFLRVVLVDCIAKRNCSVFLYWFSNILRPKHFFKKNVLLYSKFGLPESLFVYSCCLYLIFEASLLMTPDSIIPSVNI